MSFLLSPAQFVEVRAEVRSGTVSPVLYEWLGNLVALTQASHSLAPAPVPGGRWDDPDAVQEALHAWLAESLLEGGLQQAFDRCESPRALARYLEKALRNWLIARARARSGPRLAERARQLLNDPDGAFRLVREGRSFATCWWGLATEELDQFFDGADESLVSHAWGLGDFAPVRFSSSDRSDPVLSTTDLASFLEELLRSVGACLSGRHIETVLRARFAYAYPQREVDFDEVPEPASGDSPEQQVAVQESARLALVSLSSRQLRVLLERPTTTLEKFAERLQVSRGTVDNEYRRAVLKVRECSSEDDFEAVLEKVVEMASEDEHRDG